MNNPNYGSSNAEIPEGLMEFIGTVMNLLMWLGAIASGAAFALLLVLAQGFTTGGPQEQIHLKEALGHVDLLQQILLFGLLGFGIGSAFRLWGEPHLPIIQVVVALVVVMAPAYMPMIPGLGDPEKHPVMLAAYRAFQTSGTLFAIIAAIVLIVDIGLRVKDRMSFGMKADQLKFGKGIKEEVGAQNTFMGKCWQLPYCRKFVRERCPIFHAKKACWREKVGCMCEEEVIRSAMENRAIPRDMVAAAKYIPQNNKLTLSQKKSRCKQCVIYNEHQKHKYRLYLAVLNVGYVAFAILFWSPLSGVTNSLVHGMESVYKNMTFKDSGLEKMLNASTIPFTGLLQAAILLIIFTYCLKTLEYLIFKLKV